MPYADVCWKLDRELALSAKTGQLSVERSFRSADIQ